MVKIQPTRDGDGPAPGEWDPGQVGDDKTPEERERGAWARFRWVVMGCLIPMAVCVVDLWCRMPRR